MRILAYLDPGSGSLLMQILAGGIAGAATIFVVLRRRISSFFHFGKRNDEIGTADDEA